MSSSVTRFVHGFWIGAGLLACAPRVWAAGAPCALAAQEPGALAPDGRPGLGKQRTARELGRLMNSPTASEQVLLSSLYELSSDLFVLREMARRSYDRRGYFGLLERRAEPELADLQSAFERQLPDANQVLFAGGLDAARLADMMLDLRFRLRIELFEVFAQEGPELRRGLALLKASQDGYYDLKNGQARAVAARIDLAAARLRAVRSDLDALRERGDSGAPGTADPAWRSELLNIRKINTHDGSQRVLQGVEAKLEESMSRLRSVLFSPRLEPRLQAELDRRRALVDQAALHLERARGYLMLPPFDQNPSQVVLDMSRLERHSHAFSEGLRGLDLDPLNEELSYLTGVASAEFQDPRLSRAWFDRFLALRGIRSADHRTVRDKQLTPEEVRALEEVARAVLGPR